MNLARRFQLFLAPVVLLVGAWHALANWMSYEQELQFIATKAMQIDIQDLKVLAKDPIFTNYIQHLSNGFPEYAEQDIKEVRYVFRNLMENARKYDRTPDHIVLFSASWEILALETDDHPIGSRTNDGQELIHIEPFYTTYTDFSVPYSQLNHDHHKAVVPIGRDANQDGVLSADEIDLFLHSEFLLPLADFRAEARKRLANTLWIGAGQMVLLILTLIWAGRFIPRPFREMTNHITTLAQGDLRQPMPATWKIRELDLLAQAINRMQTELSQRESSILSARNQAEESRIMLLQVLDTIPVHVFWKDTACRYLGCNARFATLAGLNHPKEIIQLSDHDLLWKEQAEVFQRMDQQVMTTGQAVLNHLEPLHSPNGTEHWLEISKVPLTDAEGQMIGVLGASHDVTERHRLERELIRYSVRLDQHANQLEEMVQARTRQLIHAERLATLGTFSAGMAHEINNPNAFIAANTQFLQQYWQLASPILQEHASQDRSGRVSRFHDEIGKTLDGILDGSARISKIVNSLKTYSKGGMEADRVECRLEDPIRDAENLLRHRLQKDRAVLRVQISRNLTLFCDRQQMAQVFVNLFNNALDALEEMRAIPEKRITVEGQLLDRHVWVWVRDNGPGIPESALSKIFDPFYTTKGKTKGTGLGLSIVEGIIKDHRGQITIHSSPDQGQETEVVIILPSLELYREQIQWRDQTKPGASRPE